MTGPRIFLLSIGVFYSIAGVVAARAALTNAWLTAALDALGETRDPVETERTWWLVAGAALVSAGGLLLVVSSTWAVVPFVVSALSQALYLAVLAPRRYDAVDPPSAEGRRQTVNAFWIYLAMTAVVCFAAWIGELSPLPATSVPALVGVTVVWLVGVGSAVRQLRSMQNLPPVEPE